MDIIYFLESGDFLSNVKRWWFLVLLVVVIIFVCGFWLFTRPLISYQKALKIANQSLKNIASGSEIQFDSSALAWYDNGRFFDPHRVYIVTGEDNAHMTTINYVQALVDARNGKVIAIYSIDHPYQNMFSQTSVSEAEQVAGKFLKPPKQ